nr:hypothetical protein HK105_004264 [Polyrhizophydium stewartii]
MNPEPIISESTEMAQMAETMQVVYDYSPNLFDELELHVGDNVIVKCKFDDGWAFGFNMSTKQEGSFPLACVAPLTTQRDTLPPLPPDAMAERIRQRASSLYVPSNGNGAPQVGPYGGQQGYPYDPQQPMPQGGGPFGGQQQQQQPMPQQGNPYGGQYP